MAKSSTNVSSLFTISGNIMTALCFVTLFAALCSMGRSLSEPIPYIESALKLTLVGVLLFAAGRTLKDIGYRLQETSASRKRNRQIGAPVSAPEGAPSRLDNNVPVAPEDKITQAATNCKERSNALLEKYLDTSDLLSSDDRSSAADDHTVAAALLINPYELPSACKECCRGQEEKTNKGDEESTKAKLDRLRLNVDILDLTVHFLLKEHNSYTRTRAGWNAYVQDEREYICVDGEYCQAAATV